MFGVDASGGTWLVVAAASGVKARAQVRARAKKRARTRARTRAINQARSSAL